MYYHRGLRLRPELAVFRLGVQKAQEAIENTIGSKLYKTVRFSAPENVCDLFVSVTVASLRLFQFGHNENSFQP